MLFFFESNTRSATIIGIVGAGGIGLQLSERIRTFDFDQVAFIVLLILGVVAAIDWISGSCALQLLADVSHELDEGCLSLVSACAT